MPASSTVLIIDDEPVAREALEALLTQENYQLVFAPDGPEGLARAAELYPDVILLDVMMPGMDGFEVCRRLRADPLLAEAPVVMITALDDQDSRLRGLEAGADDFISKPFNKSELRARLRTICRLNRYRLLLAERARFQWMVEQSQDGYLLLNPDGNIRYANRQAQLYLNLAEETDGQNFLDAARRQYHCEPEAAWQAWPASDFSARPYYLVRPETPTAPVFWLQVTELDLPQSVGLGHVVQLREVTEALTNQRDMRRFDRALAHKLRTPLSGIQLSLHLLKAQTPPPSAAEVVELATLAGDDLQRLDAELKDVFQYFAAPALAKAGQGVPLSQFSSLVAPLADKLHLAALDITLAETLPIGTLVLSQPALELIIWELLENAHKFHPTQAPHVEISVTPAAAPQTIQIRVSDDGVSLSPEQINWALTPYIQSEKYFTGEMPGMGLGLPLVNTLVCQAGGRVRLANRPDRPGVVVELMLPLAEAGPTP